MAKVDTIQTRRKGYNNIREKFKIIKKDLSINKHIYILLLPVVLYYIIMQYIPMIGNIMAFKNYSPRLGVLGSPWVGLKQFKDFFSSIYFTRVLKNTLFINAKDIIFGFPMPIIFALLINEIRSKKFKKTVQTITYLPHFISIVIICGMVLDFFSREGIINQFLNIFGINNIAFMSNPKYFHGIFVGSGIWQGVGWGSIIYLAAISGIDYSSYEAAIIDGAGRFKQIWHITLPGILPTIVVMLILRVGKMLNIGVEKIILLYNPATYETADVISSFIYRKGLIEMNYSYSTAVGLFNSTLNMILLITTNYICRKTTESKLW